MKLLDIVRGETDNAPVFTADTVLASKLKDDGLADGQHGAGEIARHHDVLPRCV